MTYVKPESRAITVLSGAQLSDAQDLGRYTLVGFFMPATLTSTTMTIHTAPTLGGTYVPVYDSDNNPIAIPVGTSRYVGLSGAEADAVASCQFIKLFLGSAEGGDRAIIAKLK